MIVEPTDTSPLETHKLKVHKYLNVTFIRTEIFEMLESKVSMKYTEW